MHIETTDILQQQRSQEEKGRDKIKTVLRSLAPTLKRWSNVNHEKFIVTGSYVKGTSVNGGTDVDLLISLSPELSKEPVDIYRSLLDHMRGSGYRFACTNYVSVGVTIKDVKIDLIPAVRYSKDSQDHKLFNRKTGEWLRTNFLTHTQFVALSGRLSEIRLMKIWRNQRELVFPSFLLEMTVIEALKGKPMLHETGDLGGHITQILNYLAFEIRSKPILDPANSDNIISADLLKSERMILASAAQRALAKGWSNFLS